MRTNTRKEAESRLQNSQAGPFVIRQRNRRGVNNYQFRTKGDSWSFNYDLAWQFGTQAQARTVARHLVGAEVTSVYEVLADRTTESQSTGRPAAKPAVVELVPVGPAVGKMTPAQRDLLKACEEKVQDGLEAAKEARAALLEIRDRRLYRDQFATFEEYMAKRWNYSARHGHRMCDWAIVEANLLTEGSSGTAAPVLPAVESQARPLAKLEPTQQREAWKEAVESAPNGKPTAKHVQAAAQKRLPAPGIEDPKPETLRFDWRESWAVITVRQISDSLWASGAQVHSAVNSTYSQQVPLKPKPAYSSREEAVMEAAATIQRWQIQARAASSPGSGVYEVASKILAWAVKQENACRGKRGFPEPLKGEPIQVKAHERKRGQYDPMMDAKDRAFDSSVELNCAVDHINLAKQEGRNMVQLLYQAERAKDHLECLRALIERELTGKEAKR